MSKTYKNTQFLRFKMIGLMMKYSEWIGKAPTPTEARCLICKKNCDMGASAFSFICLRKETSIKIIWKKINVY